MAKEKMVAKTAFDDGSKKGSDGKATDYKVGEEYKGRAEQEKSAKDKGLICTESELEVSKAQLDSKDEQIAKLEKKLADAHAVITKLENQIAAMEEAATKP